MSTCRWEFISVCIISRSVSNKKHPQFLQVLFIRLSLPTLIVMSINPACHRTSVQLIILSGFSAVRQALLHTQYPVPKLCIRPSVIPGHFPGAPPEIRLYLLPVQIRVVALHDSPFHQKGRAAGDERRGKGCSCILPVSSSGHRGSNPHSRRRQIRFCPFPFIKGSRPSSGKVRIGKSQGIIGGNSNGQRCRRRVVSVVSGEGRRNAVPALSTFWLGSHIS